MKTCVVCSACGRSFWCQMPLPSPVLCDDCLLMMEAPASEAERRADWGDIKGDMEGDR